jgi:hypothetical protein
MCAELSNRHDVVSAIEGRLETLAGSGIATRSRCEASKNKSRCVMKHDMLFVHSRTCGQMQTKKASDDQRPRIIVLQESGP